MSSAEDIEKLLEEAGDSHKTCLQPGLGLEKTVQCYNETSVNYDKFVGAFEYTGHLKLTEMMMELYPDEKQRGEIKILDVAAGTGLVGQELLKNGFKNVDALDPSPGMLEMARKKNVYQKFYTECIDDRQLPIEENTYDAIVICGGFAENCVPCCALKEMTRLVKPGGYIVNVTAEEHVKESDMYTNLDDVMWDLEQQGRWKELKNDSFPDCLKGGRDGLMLVHKVLM